MGTIRKPIRRKVVVVGDGGCGKTSLLISYTRNTFPDAYVPTVFDSYVAETVVDRQPIELSLWDTAGQEDYDRLRPLSYPDAHVILLCFSIDKPESLQNIVSKWNPEITHFCPKVQKILVGLKSDLRNNATVLETLAKTLEHPVSFQEGEQIREKINAVKYCEVSALKGVGIRSVFDAAIRATLNKTNTCSIM